MFAYSPMQGRQEKSTEQRERPEPSRVYQQIPVNVGGIDSRYRAAADLLDGYVHESRFLHRDQSPDHRIIWASQGFESVFGCTVDEYNGRSLWGGFYHPKDAEAARLRAARLRRGETVEAEVQLIRENGESRWLYVKNQPVFDSLTTEVVGVLGVGQDITRRKLSEETLRAIIDIANREQHRIAVDLHDGLGQELTGAALMLRSLADKIAVGFPAATLQVEEIIALINGAIHGVRALAHGLSPVDLERGDLRAALASLAARTQEDYRIVVRFDSREPDFEIDTEVANHLYRIAQEAVSNAVRHSGANHVAISLVQWGDNFELRVEDDGCGISPAEASRSGMGLRIIKYRAQMIGAQAGIEAREKGGTLVTCRRTHACRSWLDADAM